MILSRLDSGAADFEPRLQQLLNRSGEDDAALTLRVAEIVADVRARGDQALRQYSESLDHYPVADAGLLEIDLDTARACLETLQPLPREALQQAAERIRRYHQRQKVDSWSYRDEHGTLLGQQVSPLDRVGVYVPGGRAAYPSSVLMNVLPAKVAGVAEVIMVVPCPGGERSPMVLAAAAIAGVDRIFTIGGAQAVAALAYGTDTVPAVDKIVGPGNRYVAEAKRQVFGQVGIDMIAGPSEILVICDGGTDPEWVALDLLSQAEHGPDSQSILLTPNKGFADQVESALSRLLPGLQRGETAAASLRNFGAIITLPDLSAAIDLSNRIAPEHLELSLDDAESWLPSIRHAGAIFLGRHTPEALGDYCAGPNHVLPTSGTARFSSPLGVYDFQKRSSIIGCSAESAARLAAMAVELATGEGLEAHARSAAARLNSGAGGDDVG
ncbi:MAG: histidinol dehydrogenase [Gammaproteobacteria bacterium]|nr:histidinol dehydrogenase [Gammaproteobacteria bacterium]